MKRSVYLFAILSLLLVSCSTTRKTTDSRLPAIKKSTRVLEVKPAPPELKKKYNADAAADSIEAEEFSGFKTDNKTFMEEVIKPAIVPHLDELSELSQREIINELTIFTYHVFQEYFGKSFYRWGGDILDLDDPQVAKHRYNKSFGLDCSGFAVSGYELAVIFNLVPPEDALFSSKGYQYYCTNSGFKDAGGRSGNSNNYRLDTRDLVKLGDEVISIPKGGELTRDQAALLKAGDVVGRNGHVGVLIEMNNRLYYLESGGWVVPRNGYSAYPAAESIKMFAQSGPLTIRRCLK